MGGEKHLIFQFFITGLELGFAVRSFEIDEAVSELYVLRVTVNGPIIKDTYAALNKPAILQFLVEDKGEVFYNGIVTGVEMNGYVDTDTDSANYTFEVRPALYATTLTQASRVWLGKSVPDIVRKVLTDTGLVDGKDFEIKVRGTYEPREYVVQYQETDFDFISRLMEHEGIYYCWTAPSIDGDDSTRVTEKLLILDNKELQPFLLNPADNGPFPYEDITTALLAENPVIMKLDLTHRLVTKEVMLKDYNYRKPTVDIKGQAPADAQGVGTFYSYGEHFKTPAEGDHYAEIRGQELSCRARTWFGGALAILQAGRMIKIIDHPVSEWNGKYLLTRVRHEGHQPERTDKPGDRLGYRVSFYAIPADTQFRPERVTPKPKVYGIMHATIDAAASGEYAEIDEMGRYKVKLPFDLSDVKDGKASRWMRMAQPYSGPGMGMHFPLHKGTEVLLIHLDGDPDRPIIVGSVPNPDTGSPVTGGNQTQSVIHTGGGNKIVIEDSAGGQRVALSSPTSDTYFSIGAPPA